MKKFSFRLQKVLEYREAMEGIAQEAYLDTRVARLEAEASVLEVQVRRQSVLDTAGESLSFRQALELHLLNLDDEERQREVVVEVLAAEEAKALENWRTKKQELEALIKLKEKAKQEYDLEFSRYEQAQLDEWAVQKRTA